MAKRLSLGRLEKMVEELDRDIDLEGSDVTVNTLTADLGVTATAGGVTATAGGLVVTAGQTILRGADDVLFYSTAPTTIVDDAAAIIKANFSSLNQVTVTGNHSKDLCPALDLISTFGLTTDNDTVDCSVINLAAGNTLTIAAGHASITLVGAGLVSASTSALFRVRRTGASACTVYRVA